MSGIAIPAGFKTTGNMNNNLKKLIIAQSIGFTSHKARIDRLLRSLAPTRTINGKEVYASHIQLKNKTCDYKSEQSELLKMLLGMDEDGLQDICTKGGGADDVWFKWTTRAGYSKADFQNALKLMTERFVDVSTVEIITENISYNELNKKPNPDYEPGYWEDGGTDEDGNELADIWHDPVGEEFIPWDYDDRIPLDISVNAFTPSGGGLYSLIKAFEYSNIETQSWVRNSHTLMRNGINAVPPKIILRNVNGSDITSSYDKLELEAIMSMLLIYGSSFMNQISPLSKVSERYERATIGTKLYAGVYIVTGSTTYSTAINQTFIDDNSDTYWHSITLSDGGERYFPRELGIEVEEYKHIYGRFFWQFRDTYWVDKDVEAKTDGLFIYNDGNCYLVIDKFRTVSFDDYGRWIFALAYIQPTKSSHGCCGIGGFFGDFLKSIIKVVGSIIAVVVDVITEILILATRITGIYALLTSMGMSDSAIHSIMHATGEVIATIIFAIMTSGASELIKEGSYTAAAYLVMYEITGTTVASVAVAKVAIQKLVTALLMTELAGIESVNVAEEKEKKKEKEDERKDTQSMETTNSIYGDKREYERELNFNPFARMELSEHLKYNAYLSFERKDQYQNILN